jgi:hypothetical protein
MAPFSGGQFSIDALLKVALKPMPQRRFLSYAASA